MWRSKKFIVVTVLAAVVLLGSIGGAVFAQTGTGDDSQPKSLLDRVAEILADQGINVSSDQLKEAFTQAQDEMKDEALDKLLQKLVDADKITQEQADQYKGWLQARPDMDPFRQQLKEWQQAKPEVPPQLKEWKQGRPDMPPSKLFGRFLNRGFHGGMK
jgi:ATP-dependent exoDNAse (exonuclease V) alpha subunit